MPLGRRTIRQTCPYNRPLLNFDMDSPQGKVKERQGRKLFTTEGAESAEFLEISIPSVLSGSLAVQSGLCDPQD